MSYELNRSYSSLGITIGYGLTAWGSVLSRSSDVSCCHHVETGSEAQQASYSICTKGVSWEVKWACMKLTTYLPLVLRLRARSYSSNHPTNIFMVYCFMRYKDNFSFTFISLLKPLLQLIFLNISFFLWLWSHFIWLIWDMKYPSYFCV